MPVPVVLIVYANPAAGATPIPPHGAERVMWGFAGAGCRVRFTAPFLEADPLADLAESLAVAPDLVGFSFRNLDDAVVVRRSEGERALDTVSCLAGVEPLVRQAVAVVGRDRVVIGGMGLSAAPRAVLARLGARWGVVGPAEDLCFRVGQGLVAGEAPAGLLASDPRVVDVDASAEPVFPATFRFLPGVPPRARSYLTLARVRRGRLPIVVATGCDRRCAFCVEATATGRRIVPRAVDDVIAEVRTLVAAGFRRFWLSCSELNVPDDRHAIAVLRGLAGLRADLDLQAFLQPAHVTDDLLDAMEEAGLPPDAAHFEFGHLDADVLAAGGGPASLVRVEQLIQTWQRRGYRTLGGSALFGGHPSETDETLDHALAQARAFDAVLPDGFGLSYAVGARVYPASPLGRVVAADPSLQPWLHGAAGGAEPRVFCRPGPPRALLARVQAALAGCKGPMKPMNAEGSDNPSVASVENLVNRGILRAEEGEPHAALELFEAALALRPDHVEALAQAGLVLATRLDDPIRAREVFLRLATVLGPADPRYAEVEAAFRACPER